MIAKERLKILFIAGWYPSDNNPTRGIFIKRHAKAAALHNDVIVIAFSGRSRSLRKLYEYSDNIEDGIKTVRISHNKLLISPIRWFIQIWSIISYFRKYSREGYKPDLIHAQVYTGGVRGAILSRLFRIPLIITEHYSIFSRQQLPAIERGKTKFAMSKAEIILPVSNSLRKLIEYHGIKNKFCVVPNVVDTEIFYPSFEANRRIGVKKKILFVGNLLDHKGIPYLLEALNKIKEKRKDFILDIIGDGPDRDKYEKIVITLKLGDLVMFHGSKSPQEVAIFMHQCDFFVLPTVTYESFGVVLIEAMACGKPVIASDVGAVKEIVNNEVGLLVPPKSVKSLARALNYMLDHYKEYSPARISRYVWKRFRYEVVGQTLDEIYNGVIAKKRDRTMNKYKVGNSGYKIGIKDEWQILDIGSGHNPHPRADVLLDKNPINAMERSGQPLKLDKRKKFIIGDAESMPFKTKAFNYIIASHIAEHVNNPEKFCRELMRVGERGYIETPSKFCENLLGEPFHKWYVYPQRGSLIFEEITIHSRFGLLGKLFYAVYYINIERIGHKTIFVPNKDLRRISSELVEYFIRKPFRRAKKINYTCFEWKNYFNFKIIKAKRLNANG